MTFQPIKTVSLLALAIAGINSVHANNSAANTDGVQQLQTVIVTATRTEEVASQSLAPVTVITREDIERHQSHELIDVLRRVPGVSYSRSGGQGANTSIMMRGTNSNHVLFLIDGQRISSVTLGSAQLPPIDVNQVERIEVVRGPRTSLWGADAVGGVINIITRNGGHAQGIRPELAQTFGTRGTQETRASVEGSVDNWRGSFSAKYYNTDGISHAQDKNGNNPDEDAFRSKSITASLGYRFDNGADLFISHYDTRTESEYDNAWTPSMQPYDQTNTKTTTARWIQPVIQDLWTSTVQLGRAEMQSEEFDDNVKGVHNKFNTNRDSASWQNDFRFKTGAMEHTLTAGVDYYDEEVDSTMSYVDRSSRPVTSRDNTGFFLQNQMSYGRHEVVLALREDDHEEYGRYTTGNASYGYYIQDNLRVIGSYGTAFKAPTFNDLYWPSDGWSGGNPDLKPETSTNYELGLRGQHYDVDWSLNVFENQVQDLIEWAQVPGTWYYEPANVDSIKIKGVELELATQLAGWEVAFNTSYIEPRYNGDTNHSNIMVARPRLTSNLDISRRFNNVEVGAEIYGQSSRYTNAANQFELQGYHLLNLRAAWHVRHDVELQLRLNNVLDRDYQVSRGFNTEGFGALVSVIYRPKF